MTHLNYKGAYCIVSFYETVATKQETVVSLSLRAPPPPPPSLFLS